MNTNSTLATQMFGSTYLRKTRQHTELSNACHATSSRPHLTQVMSRKQTDDHAGYTYAGHNHRGYTHSEHANTQRDKKIKVIDDS